MTLYPFGLCAALGAILLLAGLEWYRRGRRMPAETVPLFGAIAVPLSVIFCRALFCLFHWKLFAETYENPWLTLCFWDGGLSMLGLLPALLLASRLTAKALGVRPETLRDGACLFAGLLLAALFAGEGFTELGVGKVVGESDFARTFPFLFLKSRMGVGVEYRLAVYRYQAAACLLLFGGTLLLARQKRREGDLSLWFLSMFAVCQIFLESLRDDGHMLIVFLRLNQLGAAILLAVVLALLTRRAKALEGGKRKTRVVWGFFLACVAALVALEFSLDGRLALGDSSMGRDYALMALVCALLAALPCSLLRALRLSERPNG